MVMQFGENGLNLPDEHATIPHIVSIAQIALCGCQVRLFYKALSAKCTMTVAFTDLLGKTNVTITRFGSGWFDAQCHHVSVFCQFVSQVECLSECLYVCDDGICAEGGHDRP